MFGGIAVLGWGSLIWNPRDLKPYLLYPNWRDDGPLLPIEFARISKDGRLTLVVCPGSKHVHVLWNQLKVQNIEEAIKILAKREGTSPPNIHFLGKNCEVNAPTLQSNEIVQISDWLKLNNLESAVWTGLDSNLSFHGYMPSENDIIRYLSSLDEDTREKTKEYFERTPCQIQTPFRNVVKKRLGWM